MIVISSDLVLSPGPTIDLTAPVVGWQNVVTPASISANSQATANPATEAANPSTYLRWRSLVAGLQYLTSVFASPQLVSYAAIASHNFGSAVAASIQGAAAADTTQKVLLHFEGVDASTTIVDSNVGGSAHTWTASGNAQTDTSQFKIGTSSLQCDGAGDFVSTSDSADYTLATNDFTIESWFNVASASTDCAIAGQSNDAFNLSSSWLLRRESATNKFQFIAAGVTTLTSTSLYTNVVNPGWHHIAVVRSGTTFYMFIDGVMQATATGISAALTDSSFNLFVGSRSTGADFWNGWLDEFRMCVGVGAAKYTANFTPDVYPFDQWNWQTLGAEVLPGDNSPIIWRFNEVTLSAIRLRMLPPASAIPEVAVFYAGKILQFQRHIYVGHAPLTYNRKSNVVTGFSDEATFLGRIVLGELNETQLSLQNITAAFFRSDMDPWLKNSVQYPFFFAWRPSSYPAEVGFCWMNANSQMTNQRPNGMVQVTASLRGVVQ